MSEPLILPRNCGNCAKWDGDAHCSLPWRELLVKAGISEPARVVCEKHQPKDADDVEGAAV